MKLGPRKLKYNAYRKILHQKKYKRILKKYRLKKIEWKSPLLKELKDEIRIHLRTAQQDRCIYCRRLLVVERKNTEEDIEHFLDKSKPHYRKWSFSGVNLSLSCHACNFVKSTKDMGDSSIQSSKAYKNGIGNYRWLHPYFDNYHANIRINKGWIYQVKKNAPKINEANKLITEIGLDKVQIIESYSEQLKQKQFDLTLQAYHANKLGDKLLCASLLEESIRYQEEIWFDH